MLKTELAKNRRSTIRITKASTFTSDICRAHWYISVLVLFSLSMNDAFLKICFDFIFSGILERT